MIDNRTIADAKEWLTLKEAAQLIGRHVSNLYRWTSNGTLPYEYGDDGRTMIVHKSKLMAAEGENFRHARARRSTRQSVS